MNHTHTAENLRRTLAAMNTAPPMPGPEPEPYWDRAIRFHEGQKEVQAQLDAEHEAEEDAAKARPASVVDMIRAALEGTADPVTESVPVASSGTPAALNDLRTLLGAALSDGTTINGDRP